MSENVVDLLVSQVEFADTILLNKSDLATPARLKQARITCEHASIRRPSFIIFARRSRHRVPRPRRVDGATCHAIDAICPTHPQPQAGSKRLKQPLR